MVIARNLVYNKIYLFRKRDFDMREVTGYYDGTAVQLLEPAPKTKQKVIVTSIDDEPKTNEFQNIRSA